MTTDRDRLRDMVLYQVNPSGKGRLKLASAMEGTMTSAIILGGGRSSRMGTPKGELQLQGRSLLELAVGALGFVDEMVLVAPTTPLPNLRVLPAIHFTLEEPRFGGPVAGIAAGVTVLATRPAEEATYLLPCDLPDPSGTVAMLRHQPVFEDGLVLQDDAGWPQFLLGKYHLGALRDRIAALGEVRNVSVRRFFEPVNLTKIPVATQLVADVDTPEQARLAGIEVEPPS